MLTHLKSVATHLKFSEHCNCEYLMYIRKYSLLLDLKLILMTPKIMLLKESTEGVSAEREDKNS